jgi:hypothetical protein
VKFQKKQWDAKSESEVGAEAWAEGRYIDMTGADVERLRDITMIGMRARGYSLKFIGGVLGLHYSNVQRRIKAVPPAARKHFEAKAAKLVGWMPRADQFDAWRRAIHGEAADAQPPAYHATCSRPGAVMHWQAPSATRFRLGPDGPPIGRAVRFGRPDADRRAVWRLVLGSGKKARAIPGRFLLVDGVFTPFEP